MAEQQQETLEYTSVHSVIDYVLTQLEKERAGLALVQLIKEIDSDVQGGFLKDAPPKILGLAKTVDNQIKWLDKAIALLRDMSVEQRLTGART